MGSIGSKVGSWMPMASSMKSIRSSTVVEEVISSSLVTSIRPPLSPANWSVPSWKICSYTDPSRRNTLVNTVLGMIFGPSRSIVGSAMMSASARWSMIVMSLVASPISPT